MKPLKAFGIAGPAGSLAAALLCLHAALSPARSADPAGPVTFPDLVAPALPQLRWQSLWDGQSLQGWHRIGKGDWTIEGGAIVGRHAQSEGEFSHLVSDRTFKDFAVRLKFKAVRGNSGLYFRVAETGFSGVTGFQAEIDASRDVGGLYETNGRGWVVQPPPEAVATWFRPGEWNEMVVIAFGGSVNVLVNGKLSARLAGDPGRPAGCFALQAHGGQEVEVRFKDLAVATPVELLPGPNLETWRGPVGEWQMAGSVALDAARPGKLAASSGLGTIYNGPRGSTRNLFTGLEHGDVLAHVEFMIPEKSNSGVYFMGRYEIQVYDSCGVAKDQYPGIECGGIYPRWVNNHELEGHSPAVNVSRPPGQWQTFDVAFRAPRFQEGRKTAPACFTRVVHNGAVIHERVAVSGPTRAAAFEDEKPLGPLFLQGDHGPVAYRNLWLLPLAE